MAERQRPVAAVVEDEANMRFLLRRILEGEGFAVEDFAVAEEFLVSFEPGRYDLVIQDIRMPGIDGITLLRQEKEEDAGLMVVVVTAYSTWETAVEAMRLGAFGYLRKPFEPDDIRRLAANALARRRIRAKKETPFDLSSIVHSSPAMREVVALVERIAPTDTTVLITGESGTGKELVARALHYHSHRAEAPFIPVNCGAFAESLIESELFGHVKGSFTGAIGDKKGLFELADGGTLLLDEVGEMSQSAQVRLLRVLEDHAIRPVGSQEEKRVDVRVIAASNRNLEEEVAQGGFRTDLYHRLNVIHIGIPPLRERLEDIPLLAGHFLSECAVKHHKKVEGMEDTVLRALGSHDWPGNVRELENTIERAVALCQNNLVTLTELPSRFARHARRALTTTVGLLPLGGIDLERRLADVETSYICKALEMTGGNQTKAAELLHISLRSLRYRMEKLEIERRGTSESAETDPDHE